ncbi:MAG: hypothetical protein NT099_06860 [Candidatus Saganbacteria bacterium]|nr:hypothetical protein [Candidatus Saganbacteria bacterium]
MAKINKCDDDKERREKRAPWFTLYELFDDGLGRLPQNILKAAYKINPCVWKVNRMLVEAGKPLAV